MDTFKIQRIEGATGSCAEALIFYGDREVGSMDRHAKYGYWSNGCGQVDCYLEDCDLHAVFGEDNPIVRTLSDITFEADKGLWTMPQTQKALNAALKEHRREAAQ